MKLLSEMDEYFATTLQKLKSNNYGQLTIVLGNESCDLDSAVSSIVYAVFLYWQYNQMKCKACTKAHRDENVYKDDIFIAVLNVDREDYPLKTEVIYCLKEHGIPESSLIFRNDYDIKLLLEKTKSNVILVDHHHLATRDEYLAPYVTEIIDHRPIDKTAWKYKDDTRSTIEIVGSCCTLVGQRIKDLANLIAKDVDFFNAFPKCAEMLYCTILLDTVNFSKEVNKGTLHDESIVLFLESLMNATDCEGNRNRRVDRLVSARKDVSNLTASQLLRKDLKISRDVFVPSFPILVKEFLKKPNALQAVKEALSANNCTIALLVGMDLTSGLRRDVAVYSEDEDASRLLSDHLVSWTSPSFHLVPAECSIPKCHYYDQLNLSPSRKQYMAAIAKFSR